MSEKFKVVVIGGGPAGYVCSIRLAQLGYKTACVDLRNTLGGTCLNVGCIPSKSLLNLSEKFHSMKNLASKGIEVQSVNLNLEQMMKNKEKAVSTLTKGVEFLLKKNKVSFIKGYASLKSANQILVVDDENKEKNIEAEKIVICTGSEPVPLPKVDFDEKKIFSSTGALSLKSVPKKMVVIGGGYIGLELGSVWSRLGSQVHVIEFLDNIASGMDGDISKEFLKILTKQGIKFHLGNTVEDIIKGPKEITIKISNKQGEKLNMECDAVLVAVGRKPKTDKLNLEKIGIELNNKKRIKVNKKYQTNIDNIFAIGDIIDGPMLAHKAEEEGIAVAEIIDGQEGHVNYNVIPSVVYTSPEVASVGKTEEELKNNKIDYKIGKFSLMANSRAKTIDETDGFVKMLVDSKTDKILGVHIIGSNAGELIAEMALAMEFGASSEDVARTCHAHPTFSESIKESALAVDKRAIHS
tara:strand:- start:202 stop:1602 length:1401 start_codon:yes stop_codon:yes gene_type:complete